jgi:hypothetical protein
MVRDRNQEGGRPPPGCRTSMAKKLRYMSKIAAIFARADTTHLMCTQPIANLLISTKKAGLLLYSMQLALTNVGQTTFGQAKDEEMVRDTVDEEEAFSIQQSAISERQNQNQSLRPFTAKDAEDAKKEKGLPRMDADERGLSQFDGSLHRTCTGPTRRKRERLTRPVFRVKIVPPLADQRGR